MQMATFRMENGLKMLHTVMVGFSMQMGHNMKESGRMINNMGKGKRFGQMELNLRVNMQME